MAFDRKQESNPWKTRQRSRDYRHSKIHSSLTVIYRRIPHTFWIKAHYGSILIMCCVMFSNRPIISYNKKAFQKRHAAHLSLGAFPHHVGDVDIVLDPRVGRYSLLQTNPTAPPPYRASAHITAASPVFRILRRQACFQQHGGRHAEPSLPWRMRTHQVSLRPVHRIRITSS